MGSVWPTKHVYAYLNSTTQTVFRPPLNVVTESPFNAGRCSNCAHRRRHHLLPETEDESAPAAVKMAQEAPLPSQLPSMLASSSKRRAPSSSRSRDRTSVHAILRGMGIKRQPGSSSFSLPGPGSEQLGSANRESNAGMRPPVDKKGKGKEKEMGKVCSQFSSVNNV